MTTTTITKKVPQEAFHLRRGVEFQLQDAPPAAGGGAGAPTTVSREWTMLASTGKVLTRWWGNLVLDLSGAQFRQTLALLLDHDTEQRVGFSTSVKVTDRGLEASGKLLQNELADQVLADSRAGFPWQASLMAVPTRIEEVNPGATTKVNGQELTGPLTVFREWSVEELTLTVLGADSDTCTEAFANAGGVEVEIHKEMTMTEEQKKAPATPAIDEVKLRTEAEAKGAEAERARVLAILEACEEGQHKLALELVKSGRPAGEALQHVNQDLRQGLQSVRAGIVNDPQGKSLARGNSAGSDGTSASAGDELSRMEEGPEKWKREYAAKAELRAEFPAESEYLAYRRHS